MNLHSIRWRLPLSYLFIALLTAAAAGAWMLTTLRTYYQQRERQYLERNATQVAAIITQLFNSQAPANFLQDQVTNWSFLLQSRVQVQDATGQVLADSGSPQWRQIMMLSGAPADTLVWEAGVFTTPPGAEVPLYPPSTARVSGAIQVFEAAGHGLPTSVIPTDTEAATIGLILPLASSLYGFELSSEINPSEITRSAEKVTQPIDGHGTLILSEGPAYGNEIINSVWQAWWIASLVAALVALGAGWLVSGNITVPVLALTQVTEQMSAGNLAARANAYRRDEFGALGASFNSMAERVEATIHTLRAFVADAAHELNTPLTALGTNLELARTAPTPHSPELLAQAQTQLQRLTALVNQLLTLSRVEGQGPADFENVALDELVHSVSEVYASRAEQKGVRLEVESQSAVSVRGQPEQLRRALENVLDNAVKFTPEGGQISVWLTQQAGMARLAVSDTGLGLPEEDVPLLFQRFHRGRNAAAFPGSGLGLAIVRAIVERHGGHITLTPLTRGTLVEIELAGEAGR